MGAQRVATLNRLHHVDARDQDYGDPGEMRLLLNPLKERESVVFDWQIDIEEDGFREGVDIQVLGISLAAVGHGLLRVPDAVNGGVESNQVEVTLDQPRVLVR